MAKSTTANISDVNASEFDKITNQNKVVVADFWADWCKPCERTEPMFRRVAEKYSDKAAFVRLNADQNQDVMQKHNLMSVPAFAVFKNGQINESAFGEIGRDKLEGMIQRQLS